MKMTTVRCGYLPLVDCAPLIIARELKFASEEGIDLRLIKQPSWSALRDRLAYGQLDFAHMLSPMPIAMSLGLGGMACDIDVLMVLSVNGTVVGVSDDLSRRMHATGWQNGFDNPRSSAEALLSSLKDRLRIGVPFPFSMHRMLLETWLRQTPGFTADRLEIVTVPPPKMAEAVHNASLDMFCVGEPWGSIAVQHSNATLLFPGASLWKAAPEKVLGVQKTWATQNPSLCHAMIRAIYKASCWLSQEENTPLAVEILARSPHLSFPDQSIEPALTGQFTTKLGQGPVRTDRFVDFHKNSAFYPWPSQAVWIADVLSRWHHLDQARSRRRAQECFRGDVLCDALALITAGGPMGAETNWKGMAGATAKLPMKETVIPRSPNPFSGAIFDFSGSKAPE